MSVSIDDIVKKEFSRSLMGYDAQEVDMFLDSIIERIERMELEREELVRAMEKLLKRAERLDKATDGEKRAMENGGKPVRKLPAAAAAGPVRVRGGKPKVEAGESPSAHRGKSPAVSPKPAGDAAPAAPVSAKPVRPAAKPNAGDAAPAAQRAPGVAIEYEPGPCAPENAEIIPDLISDIENALLDGSIRPASRKEAPLRAADKSRVS